MKSDDALRVGARIETAMVQITNSSIVMPSVRGRELLHWILVEDEVFLTRRSKRATRVYVYFTVVYAFVELVAIKKGIIFNKRFNKIAQGFTQE